MNSKSRHITAAISLLVVFAIAQVCIGASFAGAPSLLPDPNAAFTPQQATGILTTKGNKEITVNGAPAISGATIISGATLETPEAVGSSVQLGSRGSVEIAAGTRLTIEFSQTNVRVMLFQGCVVMLLKGGTTGEVDTSQGVADKTTSVKPAALSVCLPAGATTPIVNAGMTGAVIGPVGSVAAGGGGLFGLGLAATAAVIGGAATAVILPIALRGDNPSPSAP